MASIPTSTARRWLDVITCTLFVLSILAPTFDQFVRDDVVRGPTPEKRKAAVRPWRPQSTTDVKLWPGRYEAYFKDTFGLRDKLLRWNSLDKLFLFGVAPTSNLFLGAGTQVFYAGDKTVDVYRGLAPLGKEGVALWRAALEKRKELVEHVGGRYLFVVVPNKETIYPEEMPAKFTRLGPTRLDELAESFRQDPTVDFLDLRPAMFAEKVNDTPDERVYNLHGTHWSVRGIHAAYTAILERMNTMRPGFVHVPREQLQFHEHKTPNDTWAENMYIPDVMLQKQQMYSYRGGARWVEVACPPGDIAWKRSRYDNLVAPSLLVFHDSFIPQVQSLFSSSSSRATFAHRHFDGMFVVQERADVVVEVFVERLLYSLPLELLRHMDYASAMRSLTPSITRFPDAPTILKAGPESQLKGFYDTQVERASGGSGWRISNTRVTPGVYLPAFTVEEGAHYTLLLDLEPTEECGFELYSGTVGDPRLKRNTRRDLAPFPTRRKVYLAPVSLPGRCQFMLRAAKGNTAFILHDFELRKDVN